MISDNLQHIKESIPENVLLVAVSKTYPSDAVMEAYNTGQRHFGENKVQELVSKAELLPKDIQWHLIGHLQSNKVKFIAPFVSLIQSVDSLKLLKEIDKQAANNKRTIQCLLQFHIAQEESKFGLTLEQAKEILESKAFSEMKHVSIVGVMGMASFTTDIGQVKNEFKTLTNYFTGLKNNYFTSYEGFKEISMGMSSDYKIAMAEGSTIIRVGSSIFGSR
jgi:pyridoxal phosphate enzyme (YggS family)